MIAVAVAEPTPRSRLAGTVDFWPPSPTFSVASLDLASYRSETAAGDVVYLVIDELCMLSSALRALQNYDGSVQHPEAARQLVAASADALVRLGSLVGGGAGQAFQVRADAVAREDWTADARATAAAPDADVFVLHGPMKTWGSKSRDTLFFSTSAATFDPELTQLANTLEPMLGGICTELSGQLDMGLIEVPQWPAMTVGNLVGCGGEASKHPKHFAYFLPEDAGVDDDTGPGKTVVFANVYKEQFARVSQPVAQGVLAEATPISTSRALEILLLWFRGHDLGHYVSTRQRLETGMSAFAADLRGAIIEAQADVFGFLALTTDSVAGFGGLDRNECGAVFLAECLRYLRRGWQWYPDSHAALLELSFLVEGGWLSFSKTRTGRVQLHWDAESLRDGLVALERLLLAAALHGDTDAAAALAEAAGPRAASRLTSLQAELASCASVPQTLTYVYGVPG